MKIVLCIFVFLACSVEYGARLLFDESIKEAVPQKS